MNEQRGVSSVDAIGKGRALVVMPTYNEAANLATIVPVVLGRDSRIDVLVVDDGSPDGTGEIADRIAAESDRVSVVHREGKQGLGSAYLRGFTWGLERGYDYLLEMDSDHSHDPKYLTDLLRAVEADYDLVIGSRYVTGVNVINWPMSRLLLSWFANKYARVITGLPLSDATAGFKCFRREVLEAIDFSKVGSTGYAFQIEMDFRAWKKGFRLGEVPIVFVDRMDGESKMSRAIVREAVWRVWALRFSWIFGRL